MQSKMRPTVNALFDAFLEHIYYSACELNEVCVCVRCVYLWVQPIIKRLMQEFIFEHRFTEKCVDL